MVAQCRNLMILTVRPAVVPDNLSPIQICIIHGIDPVLFKLLNYNMAQSQLA